MNLWRHCARRCWPGALLGAAVIFSAGLSAGVQRLRASLLNTSGLMVSIQSLTSSIPDDRPRITGSLTAPTNENQRYTLNLSSSVSDAVTGWVIDWGDGTTTHSSTGSKTLYTHSYANAAHSYQIRITAQTTNGPVAGVSISVAVSYIAPVPIAAGPAKILEWHPYPLTLSPTTEAGDPVHNWSINWGDGTALQSVSGATRTVLHTFSPGTTQAIVTASATDANGIGTVSIPVTVTPIFWIPVNPFR